MAADAGARAVKDSGLEPSDIGTVIVATCTMLDNIPNAAAQVAHRLGIPAPGRVRPQHRVLGLRLRPRRRRGPRAGRDRPARAGDRRREAVRLDGLGRPLHLHHLRRRRGRRGRRRRRRTPSRWASGPVAWGSAGDQSQTIRINPDTRALHQEGQAVFRWATTRVAPVALRAIELAGLTPADIDVLVPHQANLRIIEAVAKRLRSQGRARRPARRRRHRALGQHLVGLDPAGAGPHARRRAACGPATPCCS